MNQPKPIALLTDFGLQDIYVGVMKGAISKINPRISVIDLTHQIPPQDLIAGRFALLSAYSYFPDGTVHIAVIDPGVGSHRRGIAVEFSGGFLVGADNGLFGGVLERHSSDNITVVELNNSDYWLQTKPSNTFHGRDIFAAVGAHLASGVKIEELGTEIDRESLIELSLPTVKINEGKVTGCIQYIDRFGNLITDIIPSYLQFKPQVKIKRQLIPVVKTYSDRQKGELVALIGSHGYLEIAVNCGSAKQKLQVEVGEKVELIQVSNETLTTNN